MAKIYLIDTNHCSSILKRDTNVIRRVIEVEENLAINTIIYQELILMAEKSQRRQEVIKMIEGIIEGMTFYEIDKETAKIHAQLNVEICNRLGPKSKEEKRKFDIEKIGYKPHDLWVASTAIQHNLTVVSEDGVFKKISEIRELRTECWI